MKITVNYMGPSLNKIYAGEHWSKRKAEADNMHFAVMAAIRDCLPAAKPVVLIFQPYIRGRCYDCSNYAYSAKMIEDGLVQCGILANDTNEYVKAITILAPIKINKPAQSFMEVEIKDAEETK